jgi:hypothetical protein
MANMKNGGEKPLGAMAFSITTLCQMSIGKMSVGKKSISQMSIGQMYGTHMSVNQM